MSQRCPYCHDRDIETVATIPYVRGRVVAHTLGVRKFMGCRRCVRRAIYKEVGVSSLIGWFSVTAVVLNPMMITYGAVRGLFVRSDEAGVKRALEQAGIPDDGAEADPLRVAYGLAAAMIAADGKVEDEEVAVTLEVGRQLFVDFVADDFFKVLANHKDLPGVSELAFLLGGILEDQEKALVFGYLAEIAASDGHVADEEKLMLEEVRTKLGISESATLSFARGQLPPAV
ncbi:TerB family tellurite resistance protein [Enhygromyxa salina]|nr:TerB family tellurite resistance protein [Enhygromyxa salina]